MYFLPKEEFTLDQQVCGQDGCIRLEKEVEKEEFPSNRVFLYFCKREGESFPYKFKLISSVPPTSYVTTKIYCISFKRMQLQCPS